MKKILFSFIFSAFLTVLNVDSISACDCILGVSDNLQELVEPAYKNSDAVFSGEVIKIEKKVGNFVVKVRFKVEKSWKNVSQKEVVLIADKGDECGYKFGVGEKYLVYAEGDMTNLETNNCTRTSTYESNKDIEFLNQIKNPEIISSLK